MERAFGGQSSDVWARASFFLSCFLHFLSLARSYIPCECNVNLIYILCEFNAPQQGPKIIKPTGSGRVLLGHPDSHS